MYNMDYISHGDSPLTPENWYYQQWESNRVFGSGGSLADIPIWRSTSPAICSPPWRSGGPGSGAPGADMRTIRLWSRPRSGGDLVLPKRAKSRLLLPYPPERRLVMRVEYEGSKDLTQFLPRFAQMLDTL